MKLLLSFCAVWLAALSASAGSIHGVVRAKGKEGLPENFSPGQYASRRFKFAERINYDDLRDFVVYLKGPMPGAKPPSAPAIIRQKDAMFIPHVLPIMVGTKVDWPNEDDVFHNVFSKSDASSFDLELYKKGDPAKEVVFDKPGKVDVFCSIHARMSCVVLVLENPCFSLADANGRYTITNVPAGSYQLVAWHERLPDKIIPVTVKEGEDLALDITMGIENLPKY
ncbi:MAG TPA: carboxypeptidase regulatory-like domain-containing protein [Verrucomicrobiae bacterium]|jgi:plastocyanin|nr:carboxypeptidase regulatory-like domain-containing protein [Verrucomicrobiae bacterium]